MKTFLDCLVRRTEEVLIARLIWQRGRVKIHAKGALQA
jgi:hypothetical protein